MCCLEQLSNWFLRLALDQFVQGLIGLLTIVRDSIQWLGESPSPLD